LEFFEAANGLEVIEILKELQPDLLITDVNMPKCDGIDLVKRLKANPKTSTIPVIVMTSAGNVGQRTELESLGVSSILSKPFAVPDAVDIANTLLGGGGVNDKEGEW